MKDLKKKKFYQKPLIQQVKLILDEAVLQACKTTYGSETGKGNKGCGHPQCKVSLGS